MKSKHCQLILLLLSVLTLSATAQEYYDITKYYLQNYGFDDRFDYGKSDAGNVEKELLPVDFWTADHTAEYTVTGVYELGTKKTFNNAKIPAKGADGQTTGGVLALSTGWDQSLRFKQSVQLPRGTYKLVAVYYNGDAAMTAGTSLLAWTQGTTTVASTLKSFPVGKWVADTITFKLSLTKKGTVQIGFQAASGASTNSAKIVVDYVKLLRDTPYGEVDLTLYKTKLSVLIDAAEKLYDDGTGRGAAQLKEALDKAKAAYDDSASTVLDIDAAYELLDNAVNEYKSLKTLTVALTLLIENAESAAQNGTGDDTALQQAVTAAKATLASDAATASDLQAAQDALQAALDDYHYSNPTGNIPTVTAGKRFVRGATMAFGRMTVKNNGATIRERGFCWSEQPHPTFRDEHVTKTTASTNTSLTGVSGDIYVITNLKPATRYYMRPYAITNGYQVAYGEEVKFCTIPKGSITYTLRSDDDGTGARARIKAAMDNALDYWNNLTEMKGFSPNVGFVNGVPTADCSYGGYIRVGSNQGNQKTGTMMHEMLHGCGVIPGNNTEWSRLGRLRTGSQDYYGSASGSGDWLGERTNNVVKFFTNNESEVLHGDYQHLWPFGINGANTDNGEAILYMANGAVCQALGEDGLQHTWSSFAEPYYALDQEDSIKYYIKNEATSCGLYNGYLMPTATGTLRWQELSADAAAQNDSAAWYITFTPQNQYYQLRNAATGQYMTYNGSTIKTVSRTAPLSNDNWQLMMGRNDVGSQRGYWIIHPESGWEPHCLQANTNGSTAAATFDLATSAERQRWLIMPAQQAKGFEESILTDILADVNADFAQMKALLDVPHTEEVAGTDQTLSTAIADMETRAAAASQPATLLAIASEAGTATLQFLQNVTATDAENPFNLTYMMQNPTLATNSDGWSESKSASYGCIEFFQTTFDFNQTLRNMPAGNYQLRANAFQRTGSSDAAYNSYAKGNNMVNAYIYAGSQKEKLQSIAADAQTKSLGGGEKTVGTGLYMPNSMQAASYYFAKGLYENSVNSQVTTNGGTLKVGIRCSDMPTDYWVIFNNFRLMFYGAADPATLGVKEVTTGKVMGAETIFTLDGRKAAASHRGLQIVKQADGTVRKVVVR